MKLLFQLKFLLQQQYSKNNNINILDDDCLGKHGNILETSTGSKK